MSVASTLAPSAAKASAVARPMPCAAAVTNARLPASRPAIAARLRHVSAGKCHARPRPVNPDAVSALTHPRDKVLTLIRETSYQATKVIIRFCEVMGAVSNPSVPTTTGTILIIVALCGEPPWG